MANEVSQADSRLGANPSLAIVCTSDIVSDIAMAMIAGTRSGRYLGFRRCPADAACLGLAVMSLLLSRCRWRRRRGWPGRWRMSALPRWALAGRRRVLGRCGPGHQAAVQQRVGHLGRDDGAGRGQRLPGVGGHVVFGYRGWEVPGGVGE